MNHLFEVLVLVVVILGLSKELFETLEFKAYWRTFRIWRLKFLWKQNCKLKVFVDRRGNRWAKKLNDWKAFD